MNVSVGSRTGAKLRLVILQGLIDELADGVTVFQLVYANLSLSRFLAIPL